MLLTEINIYPIKSARGISLETGIVEARGLSLDRRWMLVDEQGVFMTQRNHPRMSLITVQPSSDHLRIEAPGMEKLHIPFDVRQLPRTQVEVWEDQVDAVSMGLETGKWFNDFLGTTCQLVYMPDNAKRPVDSRYGQANDEVSFADGYPFLLISEASLEDLNRHLERPVPMNRFRPNLVVAGCAPFAEDTWRRISIGAIGFRVVKPCDRCPITTVEQSTGISGKEPLHTLSRFRKRDGKVLFGQNLIPDGVGSLRVGDEVRILDPAD